MQQTIKVDIAIVGAGAGGLSVAAGASQMGVSVALVEASKMGGDCLNYGCVPSKALIAAAKTAELMRKADKFGLVSIEPTVDLAKVMDSVQAVITNISVNDSVERFTQLGVKVIEEQGIFQDANTLRAGNVLIKAKRFVIATGSSPAVPPIPGLADIPYYTNETIFSLRTNPQHLVVIGGGPIGCELAQAFLQLGIKVTLLEAFTLLPREEKDLVSILRDHLIAQGLNLHEKIKIVDIQPTKLGIEINIEHDGKIEAINCSHVLVAAGRTPNVNNLNLEAAKVGFTSRGIKVDQQLRTSNNHIYAIGDVVGGYQFTHVANYHAGIVLRNILFKLPAKNDQRVIPWVTYTSPELAHVGMTLDQAKQHDPKAILTVWHFAENDRAQTERDTIGQIRVVTNRKGIILGVSMLGPAAGELITPWVTAIALKKKMHWLTKNIVPYPTLSEINKRVAGEYYTPVLFSRRIKWLIRFLKIFW